jgi:hypothetical protein
MFNWVLAPKGSRQARVELLAVQEQMRAETRALNEQETRLATASMAGT